MRTRSQDPAASEDRHRPSISASSPASSRNGEDSRAKSRDGQSLSAEEVTGVHTRKSVDRSRQTARGRPQDSSWTIDSPRAATPRSAHGQDTRQAKREAAEDMNSLNPRWRRLRSPWSCTVLTLLTTFAAVILAVTILQSFVGRQLDPKGCNMSYMRPAFAKFSDFDSEHTRFATKYSLYLYREGGIDEDTRVKGVPILFIPGNAGSYKQVRPLAAEAATFFHDTLQTDPNASKDGKRPLDFFSVDFNEDITAFHGQTLLDQAEYLNEAIAYILSLYHNPNRSARDPDLPDPSSVIVVGHSMGGVVARTMLTMPNYQTNSINTIITLAAPHARAPVSFDSEIVSTYQRVNDYWRNAYSQKWANNNPLWHVTLVSIAGGGLDTVVPSDYSTTASLVPPTHGFTVFSSSIPGVWTGMDHLCITWCDQLRKAVVRSLYDVIDATRPNQTRPRAERMHYFKKRFLTGMEDVVERTLPRKEPQTLLTLEDNSDAISRQGERLTLKSLGRERKIQAHLMPVPPQDSPERKRFTLLTDQKIDKAGEHGNLEVMFCSVFPKHSGQSSPVFPFNVDVSGDGSGSTRLACKDAASDAILLPASTSHSQYPFDDTPPFSYLQFSLEELAEHQFVAIVEKVAQPTSGWLVAEFATLSESTVSTSSSVKSLALNGLDITFSPGRPMVSEIRVPTAHSSLLAYRLSIKREACFDGGELFMPLLRQYISDPYESKFFVNVKDADISLHGIAPYLPPPLQGRSQYQGLSLQLWTDPSCDNAMEVSMKVDVLGSMGKLWMRYRTVFAAFPLIIVALVLRKQFKIYDDQGVFISFTESMDQCLRTSIPVLFLGLTLLAISFSKASQAIMTADGDGLFSWAGNATDIVVNYTQNDLLLGSQDPFFWFLVPLFGLISIGVCIALNYTVLTLTHLLALVHAGVFMVWQRSAEASFANTFSVTSLRRRVITTGVLLLFVSTIIPYQFVFVVLCVVQIATCVRALCLARETHAIANINFYNYVHSIILLLLWILPINLPVLVVWVHNLAVHWLTPFSSHHNVMAIMPFVLLIETLSTGHMVPQVKSSIRHLTSVLFFALAVYAAIYGPTFAYRLHWIVNVLCAWLVGAHFWGYGQQLGGLKSLSEARKQGIDLVQGQDMKKRP